MDGNIIIISLIAVFCGIFAEFLRDFCGYVGVARFYINCSIINDNRSLFELLSFIQIFSGLWYFLYAQNNYNF